jgi:hypothetical protein
LEWLQITKLPHHIKRLTHHIKQKYLPHHIKRTPSY